MKQIIKNYTFSVSGKTVTLTDFSTIRLDRLLLIVDATTNKILYNYADSSVTAAAVATNVVTLTALQGGEANGDSLLIFYDVVAGDPIYDAIVGAYAESTSLSAGSLNADLVPSLDVSNYKWFSLQITGTWSGTLTFQCSNDGTNWVTTSVLSQGTFNSSVTFTSVSSNGVFHGPLVARYLRVRMTSYTSGTANGTLERYTVPGVLQSIGVLASQSGGWTVSGAVTASAGTNLNTSALALETGGNLAALAGAVTSSKIQSNLAQVAGTAADTNSGNKSAGTLRVVLATDQPALTNKLLVTPDSVALPAHQSTNVDQIGGSTLALGQTTMSASVPVAIASDQVIKDNYATDTTFTITLASLANSATVGRQSSLVDNTTNKYQSALVYLSLKMGTSPTANTPLYVYLLRSNNNAPIADDGAGTADAGLTVINAPLLGVINCSATTTGATYVGIFDTSVLGPLGPKWGIAVVNNSGVALDSTEGNHLKTFIGVTRSI